MRVSDARVIIDIRQVDKPVAYHTFAVETTANATEQSEYPQKHCEQPDALGVRS